MTHARARRPGGQRARSRRRTVPSVVISQLTRNETREMRTLLSSSGPFTLMKLAWLSFATAFANNVFPQPGGPQRSTPAGASIPTARNCAGLRIGCITAICSSLRVPCSAPMSGHVTSGTVANPSRCAEGCISFSASLKSAAVMQRGAS